MGRPRLIIFTRYPEPGKVKTRLISTLGREGASDLHKSMTEHTLKWAKSLSRKNQNLVEIRFDGGTPELIEQWLGKELSYVRQGEGDLGERMERAFHENFEQKKRHVILVGTDCPQFTACHAKMAFNALKSHDLVLCPTTDGGYYLIGLRRMVPELFESLAWGTETVFRSTLERAKEQGLSVRTLEPLQDVDVPRNLPVWERSSHQFISLIIPTLNEEDNLQRTLEKIGQLPRGEVIVVDGGSEDNTVKVAEKYGAKVIKSMPSRGKQMNVGASKASGDILLFLHADTLLPDGFSSLVRKVMSEPDVVGGSFALKLQPGTPFLKYIEENVKWRTKLFGLPYGDQAIFVRASVFREIGGYADIPLFEDVDFIRRLKSQGKLSFIPIPVVTSSRRYKKYGVFMTTLINKVVFFGYLLKVPPTRLVRIYYKKKTNK